MSWPLSPLSEVAEIVTGKTPSTTDEANFGGDIPFVTPADLDRGTLLISTPRTLSEIGAASIRLVPENAVLVGCIGTLGKVGMAGKPLATNQQINAVVFDEARVWPRFGYYATKRLRPEMEMMAPATTVKIISKSKFSELKIPVPPLEEQKRIAGILDEADSLRRLRTRALDKLITLGQAIFHEIFGEGLKAKVWPEVELKDAVAAGTIVTYGIVQAGDECPDGVPYIRTGDIKNGRISIVGLRHTAPEIAAKFERSKVSAGEIVMSIRATVGTTAIVPAELDGANLTQGTARIAPGERIKGIFLNYYLQSSPVQMWIQRQVKGATFREITLGRLRELPTILPPLELQDKFSNAIEALSAEVLKQEKGLSEVETLFASLQHRAF